MAQFCIKCNKKVNLFTSYKCKNNVFCFDCIKELDKIVIDNLKLFTSVQVMDIKTLLESGDALLKDSNLKTILEGRQFWLKESEKCKKELDKIEKSYKKECGETIRQWDNALKEVERDFDKYKRDSGGYLNSAQKSNYESMKQEIRDFREADLRDLQKDYQIDKKALTEFITEAKENFKREDVKLSEFVIKCETRAKEIRKEEAEKKAVEEAREKERIDVEQKVKEELEQIKEMAEKEALENARTQAERCAKEEAEKKALEEKRRLQEKIKQEAKIAADKKVKEELEQIKEKAEKEALEEAKARAELNAKREAEKLLRKSENEKKRREAREARKNNPTHLAVLSLICSIAAWPSIMFIFPPIPLAIAGIILGIKGKKSDKKKTAWAGIIIGGLLILLFIVAIVEVAREPVG